MRGYLFIDEQIKNKFFDICFDESQADPEIIGCTNPAAINYDPYAIYEDGSCLIEGCTDSSACNFEYLANIEDGSCIMAQEGYDCEGNEICDYCLLYTSPSPRDS